MIWQPCDLYVPPGVDLGGAGSSLQRNDTVNGLGWGGTCNCNEKSVEGHYINETFNIFFNPVMML